MNINIMSKLYQHQEISISIDFNLDHSIYLNATKTAKQFKTAKGNSKDINEWLSSKTTQEYILVVKNLVTEQIGNDELIVIKQGGRPQEQGTWIHKSLIVAFARWLSPHFAVWCDMTIEQILSEKLQKSQPIQPQTQNFQLPEIGNSTQKIIELDNNFTATEKLIANLRNMNPIDLFRLDQFYREFHNFSPLATFKIDLENQFFLPTELGKMINKSAVEINLMLEHKGLQIRENRVWKMTESGRDFGIEINGKFNQIKWKMKSII